MNKLLNLFPIISISMFLAGCQTSEFTTSAFTLTDVDRGSIKQAVKIEKKTKVAAVKPKPAVKNPVQNNFQLPPNEKKSLIVDKSKANAKIKRKTTKTKVASNATAKPVTRGRGGKYGVRRNRYKRLVAKHARAHGVPVNLAMAVVHTESSFKPNARGAAGEIGLMQLMPRTARFIGYKGPLRALYKPDTNLHYGMKYLGKAYKLGGRTTCGAILKYNAGHGAKRMNPISRKYCQRVRRLLRRGGRV